MSHPSLSRWRDVLVYAVLGAIRRDLTVKTANSLRPKTERPDKDEQQPILKILFNVEGVVLRVAS
jgi:hypothetical protein